MIDLGSIISKFIHSCVCVVTFQEPIKCLLTNLTLTLANIHSV